MTEDPSIIVTAPPPTPNGDLHMGHLSGPYLGADVFSRFEKLRGTNVVSAVSTDEHQSYVVTTAERLQINPTELAKINYQSVRSTLQQADIYFNVVGRPDAEYIRFVQAFFAHLHKADVFVEKTVDVYYDSVSHRFLFESYIGGLCPVCFNATKGNICEACGHPNNPFDLINAYVVNGQPVTQDRLEVRTVKALFLPLEQYRRELEGYYAMYASKMRPTLRALLKTLLSSTLPDFPITYVSNWGIRVPLPGYESSVYNAWAEMYPGHAYWVRVVQKHNVHDEFLEVLWGDQNVRLIQFLGFDNSYFYTIVHLALAFATKRAGITTILPSHFITNEFYLLQNSKFSTSQGHLILGKDLLTTYNVDAVRFYLCLSNPETQQTNFTVEEMIKQLNEHLLAPYELVRQHYNKLVERERVLPGISPEWVRWIESFQRRLELAFDPDTFSLRAAATTLSMYIKFLAQELERAGEARKTPEPGLGTAVAVLAGLAMPLMPRFASDLAKHFDVYAQLSWGRLAYLQVYQHPTLPDGLLTLRNVTTSL
jgi:methionyl-tRNA synthetase